MNGLVLDSTKCFIGAVPQTSLQEIYFLTYHRISKPDEECDFCSNKREAKKLQEKILGF